ncbi:MlaA family lipoprotein [Roseomonas sp. CAU 1739]|uniref:MlaA family lipoprotein n=1 Tax=Roseomonas sp. CAU 1739 TaxID=3140364 RepID=UPI00325BDCC5
MTLIQRLLAAALLCAPMPALAQEDASWLDRFNRAMFSINNDFEEAAAALIDAVPDYLRLPDAVQAGLLNIVQTTVNEPVSAVGHAITGRYDLAGRQMRRVATNLLAGYGGYVDRATEYGIDVPMIDIGVALCVRGVASGPYFVLPLIGPRTARDGAADMVASNAYIYLLTVPFVGAIPSIGTLIIIEVVSEFAALAMARGFDPPPPPGTAFEAARDAYIEHRTRLCEAARTRPGDG